MIAHSARDWFGSGFSASRIDSLKKQLDIGAPQTLQVKVGARVLLTRVLYLPPCPDTGAPAELMPGSLGTVVSGADTDPDANSMFVEFDQHPGARCAVSAVSLEVRSADNPDDIVAKRVQFPLIIGYAITIKRSQGMTLDKVIADFSVSDWCAVGFAYVAQSRCTRRSDIRMIGMKRKHIVVDEQSIRFAEGLPFFKSTRC